MSLEQKLKEFSSGDSSLSSHLESLFRYFLTHPQSSLYDGFESISLQCKSEMLRDRVCRLRENFSDVKDYVGAYKQLVLKQQAAEGEEVQESGPTGYVPNFLEESKLFQYAGVYFGEEENYLILKSLTKLS